MRLYCDTLALINICMATEGCQTESFIKNPRGLYKEQTGAKT